MERQLQHADALLAEPLHGPRQALLAGHRYRQLVPTGGLRRAGADLGQDSGDVVEAGRVARADGDPLTADHPLEALGSVVGDHPAVVDHADLVGQCVGLVEVLSGEQHGRALGDEVADDVPHVLALGRVQTGGGLVEEDDGRPADQARGQIEPAAHAARVRLGHLAGGVGQVEPGQQLPGADLRLPAAQIQQLADHHQVLGAGEVFVDRGVLAGQADGVANLLRLADDVVPADPGGAGVGLQQGGQDADGGGLAGAVRAQHPEHAALSGSEVDPVQGLGGTEPLLQSGSFDHVHDIMMTSLADITRTRRCHGICGRHTRSLPKLTKATYTITSRYAGSSTVAAHSGNPVTLHADRPPGSGPGRGASPGSASGRR